MLCSFGKLMQKIKADSYFFVLIDVTPLSERISHFTEFFHETYPVEPNTLNYFILYRGVEFLEKFQQIMAFSSVACSHEQGFESNLDGKHSADDPRDRNDGQTFVTTTTLSQTSL